MACPWDPSGERAQCSACSAARTSRTPLISPRLALACGCGAEPRRPPAHLASPSPAHSPSNHSCRPFLSAPARLSDLVGADIGLHVGKNFLESFSERCYPARIIQVRWCVCCEGLHAGASANVLPLLRWPMAPWPVCAYEALPSVGGSGLPTACPHPSPAGSAHCRSCSTRPSAWERRRGRAFTSECAAGGLRGSHGRERNEQVAVAGASLHGCKFERGGGAGCQQENRCACPLIARPARLSRPCLARAARRYDARRRASPDPDLKQLVAQSRKVRLRRSLELGRAGPVAAHCLGRGNAAQRRPAAAGPPHVMAAADVAALPALPSGLGPLQGRRPAAQDEPAGV